MQSPIILPNTALCAIVRDEIINPAGGIEEFIRSTVPFVEEAIIVDGYSVDGTREKLEGLRQEYPHMQVFDHPFADYASQRNFSLKQSGKEWALVLDADEYLAPSDFAQLNSILLTFPHQEIFLHFLEISPEYPRGKCGHGHSVRLFHKDSIQYRTASIRSAEYPCRYGVILNWVGKYTLDSCVSIKHFLPCESSLQLKHDQWYHNPLIESRRETSPSTVQDFNLWKQYDPEIRNLWRA